MDFDTIVLGAGPAGLTAGIYLSRAKQKVLIVDTATAGGQLIFTHAIANYPGVIDSPGYAIAATMKKQAASFGSKILSNKKLTNFNFENSEKMVELNGKDQYSAKSIIIATGSTPRPLGIESEAKFKGSGISYCATCDGDFFQDQEIVVVGGGNSALEEAVSLTQFASKITLIHQFDHFQGSEFAIKEASENSKISFIMESKIQEFVGDETLQSVTVKNLKTNEITSINCSGTFIFIGYIPKSEQFKETLNLSKYGEILVDDSFSTNISGVFAAGDITPKKYRQITTAVSDGTIAALNAIEFNKKVNNQ